MKVLNESYKYTNNELLSVEGMIRLVHQDQDD